MKGPSLIAILLSLAYLAWPQAEAKDNAHPFCNPVENLSQKSHDRLARTNFCPMLICHGTCCKSKYPCTYSMFTGKPMRQKSSCRIEKPSP